VSDDRVSRRSFFSEVAQRINRPPGPPADEGLAALSIMDAARQLADARVTAVDLMRAVLARTSRVDHLVGAFATRIDPDLCLEWAADADHEIAMGRYRGKLHGVPIAVKDNTWVQGIPTRNGTPILDRFIPNADATAVLKLRDAGAIVVGKTSVPEWSFDVATPGTHNPWALDVNAGGSSGGSAAAVAANLVFAALGSDTTGSIRIPAAICGVVGLKPTYGRVSRRGVIPNAWSLDQVGPITRTVEDAALLLHTLAGPDPNDPSTSLATRGNYLARLFGGVEGWKIGVPAPTLLADYSPEEQTNLTAALTVFRELGATVKPVEMPASFDVVHAATRIIRIVEAAAAHQRYLRYGSRAYGSESAVFPQLVAGSQLPGTAYLRAQQLRSTFTRELRAVLQQVDVLVTPAPFMRADEPESTVAATFRSMWNLSGYPAMVVPAGFIGARPWGIQIGGRPLEEESLLAAAYAYEQATEWHTRQPAL
jgi:aspartyl-tRNA(Asn)/glutamyl-tRNA(Gln) amidotransferase subunit A